ncbi:MAG: hypothetical protein OHK0015_46560 [Chloroflexi bacterium OHK40]
MDWSKQANEMIKTWTGTQQKVWETWVSSMQLMASPQSPEAWQKTVETWRGTVRQALESQLELTRLWAEGVASAAVSMPSVPGLPATTAPSTAMVEWTRQMLEMTRSWTETQVRFSENWFDLLKKAEPAALAQGWDMGQAQRIMATWQEAAQKAVEAQSEFSKMVVKATANSVEPSKK